MVFGIRKAFSALLALSLGEDQHLALPRGLLLLYRCSMWQSFIALSLILDDVEIPLDWLAFLTLAAFAGFNERTGHIHLHIDDAAIVAGLSNYAGISVSKSELLGIYYLVAWACDISMRYSCLHLLEVILCSVILLCIHAGARSALSAPRKPLLVLRHHQLRSYSLSGACRWHLQLAGLGGIHHLKERLIITPMNSILLLGCADIRLFKIIPPRKAVLGNMKVDSCIFSMLLELLFFDEHSLLAVVVAPGFLSLIMHLWVVCIFFEVFDAASRFLSLLRQVLADVHALRLM